MGNTEMQGNVEGLQTLIVMKADDQHPHPLIFLNSISSDNHSNHPSSLDHQDVSDFHGGSLHRFHHNGEVKQGLSLSLAPQQPAGTAVPLPGGEEVRVPNNVVLSRKYLKVAQELLDEVVCMGKEPKNARQPAKQDKKTAARDGEIGGGDGRTKRRDAAEKQEFQMKKAKLINMLEQVEQRYKQYQHEMQMVIIWLEQAAGEGSAKTYTALALLTISKQFRCLKDAILAQILVEEDSLGGNIHGSRLKYIDNKLRRMMIHHDALRPHRGLPDRSVSILRAWLFDHFLHPYPKDTDKIVLAKQTGLTRSQVSNWFINARVRLWKPMVEEMYAEEVKGSDDEMARKSKVPTEIENHNKCKLENKNKTSSTAPAEVTVRSNIGLKKSQNNDVSQSPNTMNPSLDVAMNLFAWYPIVQPPYSSNNVSLTLGLENFPISPANQTMHLGGGIHTAQLNDVALPTSAHYIGLYDSIHIHNGKSSAAQLLPDFAT